MPNRFPMKEIAFQAGVSLATVDRVLNNREGARHTTKARVAAAIAELERQYSASSLARARLSLDVVIEAPTRFTSAVRQAFEAELSTLRPANVTLRFHMNERWDVADIDALLSRIRRRGSHGVILKAPVVPRITDAARRLMEAKIPVATFVTDQPTEARIAYIGIDNQKAGATAAGLMVPMFADRPADVLITLSSADFLGEIDRAKGFEAELRALSGDIQTHHAAEGKGLTNSTRAIVEKALTANPNIQAVYSVGGANEAVIQAFQNASRPLRLFAAHDLDRANRRLLTNRQLTFVIDHDLRQDARTATQIMLHHHRMLPDEIQIAPSRFFIVTPQSL